LLLLVIEIEIAPIATRISSKVLAFTLEQASSTLYHLKIKSLFN